MRPINPREYYHEQDKKALEALKSVPGFATVLKAFMKVFNEKMLHGINMASKIRLGPNQMPRIYNMLPPICEVLGIKEPELYLELNPNPNAYTSGDSQIYITVTSGLLEALEEDEIKAVLAHECGHIACHHVLYHTMGNMILNGAADLLGLGTIAIPLQLAFFYWNRCSEFSCDRAAALYMQGHESVVETMIRLSGGIRDLSNEINKDLYLAQAAEYESLVGNSAWDKTLQFLALMESTHPFTAVRAAEIKKWCESDRFKQIIDYSNGTDCSSGVKCPVCGNDVNEGWMFCKKCGTKIK